MRWGWLDSNPEDIDFETLTVDVLRSYTDGSIGPCKTEISEQPVPLDEIVIEELLEWHPVCGCPKPDWVFASHQTFGKMPMWPDSLRRKILQPCRPQGRHPEADRLAHLPPYL